MKGNWWHAFNIRISMFTDLFSGSTYKRFEYGIIDEIYDGPAVCTTVCGIGGDSKAFIYRPSMAILMKQESWGAKTDPRTTKAIKTAFGGDGYRTIMMYENETKVTLEDLSVEKVIARACRVISYVEVKAIDSLSGLWLPGATFRVGGRPEVYRTFDYRLAKDLINGDYEGGFMIMEGTHTFTISRPGYESVNVDIQVPYVCQGICTFPPGVIYREAFMIPADGRTRIILNWDEQPADMDLYVMPVGVVSLENKETIWTTAEGGKVPVYDYAITAQVFSDYDYQAGTAKITTSYGDGRQPYASSLLVCDLYSV